MEIGSTLRNKSPLQSNIINAVVEISFNPSVIVYNGILKVTWVDVLSNIGGLMGLFLGISLMQTIDLAEFVYLKIKTLINNIKNN